MTQSLFRIWTMFLRYLVIHKRSVSRALELLFWPVMELFVWGFVSLYMQSIAQDSKTQLVANLITAMIFWDLLYRSQQSVTISFIEDIWTHNILNLFISPLRMWEWLAATFFYGFLKTTLITLILGVIAFFVYHFGLIDKTGFYLLPFMANLMLFGWAVGIFTAALLIRWGHAVEALIWGVPYLLQPLSAIFYPLSILPSWVQVISRSIPSTYVFEGVRFLVQTGQSPMEYIVKAFALNIVYFILAGVFFNLMMKSSRETGRLGRLGMD